MVIAQGGRVPYAAAIPLVWVLMFAVTGDRRLFFPFAIYQAVTFGQLWRGGFVAGTSMIVAMFAVIRIEQEASFRVLVVELLVAVVAAFVGFTSMRRV